MFSHSRHSSLRSPAPPLGRRTLMREVANIRNFTNKCLYSGEAPSKNYNDFE